MDAKFIMVFLMAVVYVCIDASPAKLFYRKGTVSTFKNKLRLFAGYNA